MSADRSTPTVRIAWADGTTSTYHQVTLVEHTVHPVVTDVGPMAPADGLETGESWGLTIRGILTPRESDGQFYLYHGYRADEPVAGKTSCQGAALVDTAVEGAIRMVAEAWQIASGMDGARTPEFANALNADLTLRERLDAVLRPHVARICDQLRHDGWTFEPGSRYADRFGQQMHGLTDQEWADHQRKQGK